MRTDAGELRIRAMAEGDLDRVLEIASSLPTAPHWTRPAYEAAIFGKDGPRRIALVAEHSDEVIGFAVLRRIGPVAELETIAISEKAQGAGCGSVLLRAVLKEARLAGATEVELEVRPSNAGAIRLYAGAGFREVGRRRGYYLEPVEDAVLLRLEI
jgi:[ribosomal protein S18]-alanine N-acetyltransferase